jgi:hypothetical protein
LANIQSVRAINSPQKSYMWEVEIQGLSTGALQDMTLYAKTVSIPQSAVEQIIINHKAGKTHHAGRDASAHTVIITFWDDESQTISKFMHDWIDMIHNPITSSGVSRDIYQATLVIRLLDSTEDNVTATITLGRSFPIDIAEAALSYDSSEPIEHSVTFSYDEKTIK